MTREEITRIMQESGKVFVCDVIARLMDCGVVDITDINVCYINNLQKKLNQKDKVIHEADNCIFNSLFYDTINKTDSANVILNKVRWCYKYANTNKEDLCRRFNYDPEKDVLINV